MTTPLGAQDALKIDAAGRVGIGTSTPDPTVLLDVNGPAKVSTLTFPDASGDKISLSGTAGAHHGLAIQRGVLQIHTDKASSDIAFGHGESGSLTETMRIRGDGVLHVGGPKSTSMVVTQSGVGVGTPAPDYALDVPNGNARLNGLLIGNNSLMGKTGSAFLRSDGTNLVLNATSSGDLYLGYDQGQHIKFGVGGQKIMMTPAGNLGIGKPPDSPLDVNGEVQLRSTLWVHGDLMLNLDGKFYKIEHKWEYYVGDYLQPSDLRLKSDLQSIPSALDKLQKLRGVTYRWNDDGLQYLTRDIDTTVSAGPQATPEENHQLRQAEREKRYQRLSGTRAGVVAQDVEAVLPEAVATDEAGYKSVRHDHLIPLLIEAVKELTATVQDQSRLLTQQQEEIVRLTASHLTVQQQLAARPR